MLIYFRLEFESSIFQVEKKLSVAWDIENSVDYSYRQSLIINTHLV